VPVEIELTHAAGPPRLSVHWTTNEDDRPRPLPLRRVLLPWAQTDESPTVATATRPVPELDGGSWARGYREFFGDAAACGKCHVIYNRGGNIGPDLSNLIHRDYASVLRDIAHPSFAINPDFQTSLVTTVDGHLLTGVVQTSGTTMSIGDANGATTVLDRAQVEAIEPAPLSTMPEGLPAALGPDRMRDLLTFLLTPPPQMPREITDQQPKPRTRAEINAMLTGAPDPPAKTRPIHVVLVAGPKDHGPGEHDYPAWQRAWKELLSAADGVDVATAWNWPTPDQFDRADVVVVYQHGDWNPDRAANVDSFLQRGGGMVFIHWAVDGRAFGRELAERIGLAAGGPIGFRHGELTLSFNRNTNHPIIRNFEILTLLDETYWKLSGLLPPDRVLATAVEESQPQPQLWAVEPKNGRVFVSIPGHYASTFDDPLFRVLLLRGIAWVAREPVDRFNDLVWPGANVQK
jgi:putative heme-binding domain-containing protein